MAKPLTIRSAAVAAFVSACLCAGVARAAEPASGGPVIPNFFDPNRRLDKPPAASLAGLRFATVDDFPPFAFTGADGRLTGFNVDLARAICVELAVPCTIQARPFDSLAASIAEGRIDAAIAGIAITAESRRHLAFSDVYLRPAARFLGPASGSGGALTAASLAGRTVAVVAGSAHEAYLAAFFPSIRRMSVASPALAGAAVRSKAAEFAFGDGVQLAFWLQSQAAGGCCAFAGGPYLEARFFGEGLAVALPPDRPELRRAIDWALDTIEDRGGFSELYLRYFPVGYF